MFISTYIFPFFSFAFPISLTFLSCFLPNQMHHSLLFRLFFPRAESQQFCLCGHLYSPESSPTVWGTKLRKVTFLGSVCSQLEEMATSRRWPKFWGCHKTLWRLVSFHELPVRQTNILTYRLWIGDLNLFSINPAFAEFWHIRWMRSTNQGVFPLTNIALPGARLLPRAWQSGEVASAAQQLTEPCNNLPPPQSPISAVDKALLLLFLYLL